MFWTKRTGHLSDEELSAYIDGELTGARLVEAERHVASCPECSEAIATLREVQSLVSQLPMVEPSRSFVLTPAMAGVGQKRPEPRRQSFVFVPAVALTLLIALFAVDLTRSSMSTSSDESGTGASSQAIAKDASSNSAADSAGGASSSGGQERSTFSAQGTPSLNPAAVAPAVPSAPQNSAPSTGQGIAPPTVAAPATGSSSGATAAPPSTGAGPLSAPATGPGPQATPDVPVTGPVPATAPATGAGSPPVLVPPTSAVPQTAPQATAPQPQPSPPVPSAGGPVTTASSAGTLSSEAAADSAPPDTFDDGDGARNSTAVQSRGDEGTDWLRIAELVAAIVLIASALYVFVPGLIKKGH